MVGFNAAYVILTGSPRDAGLGATAAVISTQGCILLFAAADLSPGVGALIQGSRCKTKINEVVEM